MRDRPPFLRERIWRVQDETANIAEIEFGRGRVWVGLPPSFRPKFLEVVPPDRVRRRFYRLRHLNINGRIGRRW